MEKICSVLKAKYKYVIPIVHFLVSFIWEKAIFIYSGNWDCWFTDIRSSNVPGERAELIMVYVLSRFISFLIIMLIWRIFFIAFDRDVSRADKCILGLIFCLGLIMGIIMYPGMFGLGYDSYTNYLFARRFLPTYWHSIYTGALYSACLMVIPHPIALFVFQWLFLFGTVSYFYLAVKKVYGNERIEYVSLLLLMLPESYYLMFNTYRNNYFTILVIFYIAYLFRAVKLKEYRDSWINILGFAVLSAFVMVWRSEGLLFGIGGLFVYVFYVLQIKKETVRRLVLVISASMIAFLGLNRLQSVGTLKYYGSDYMILNTTNVLYSIFNDPDADLSYEGAADDLNAIEGIVPVELLKESGMTGYRNHNWSKGRTDFNQTLAGDEVSDAYIRAYYRIIAHNFRDFLDVQINNFYTSLQLPTKHKTFVYSGEPVSVQEGFVFDIWQEGAAEIYASPCTAKWADNETRIIINTFMDEILIMWREMISDSGINGMLHILALAGDFILLVFEVFGWINDRKISRFVFIVPFIMIIGECMAVMLFMPEGRPAYMYPVLYASYAVIFLYFTENLSKRVPAEDKPAADAG